MKHLGWKIFFGFWIIWIIWYLTGGPQRTTNVKPYLKYDYDSGSINKSNADLETGAKEILPTETSIKAGSAIKENLDKQDFSGGRNSIEVSQ
jgi:hypothetical protein